MPALKWTKEKAIESAKKFRTRKEWELNEKGAYLAAHRKGWMTECCSHFEKPTYDSIRLTESEINLGLPAHIRLKEGTFKGTKFPATFIDSEFGEYTCRAEYVIGDHRMHPERLKIVKRNSKHVPIEEIQARLPLGTVIVPETYTRVHGKATFERGGHRWEAFVYNVIWSKSGPTKAWATSPKLQNVIIDLFNEYGIKYLLNQRILKEDGKHPKEIDIFLPDYNIGIEIHGLYWHSNATRHFTKHRHADKWALAVKCNIKLLQLFEDEIRDKWPIVRSVILSKLGIYREKVRAKDCSVRELTSEEKTIFFNTNHLQGACPSSVGIGLFKDGLLVQAISLRKNKKYGLELARFATLREISVEFGFSRLMKHAKTWAIRNNFIQMVSYCDLRISNGRAYEMYGFTLTGRTIPDMFWTDKIKRFSRQLSWGKTKEDFAKRKLLKIYGTGHFRYLLNLQ